jgi:hypothetical protein
LKTSDEKRGNPAKWKGLIEKTSGEEIGALQNAKGLVLRASDEKEETTQNTEGLILKTSDEKRGTPQNAKGLVENTFDRKGGNHSKSLVPHQKLAHQHINLKGVSLQSCWICVPMFNAAQEGAITHGHVGHWRTNFLHKKKWAWKRPM